MKYIMLLQTGFCLTLLILFAGCGSSSEVPAQKIVYMDNFKVFEEFAMKKDCDKMLEKELGEERARLDAMAAALNGQAPGLEADKQKKTFYLAKQSFDARFGKLSDKYTNEVYVRLNEYIQRYGKEQGYTMIMGSNGEGSVMYVDSLTNITPQLIKYINHEYTR
jgi:outer membrane protein